MGHKKSNVQGMTLVEMLVAVTIATVVSLVIFSVLQTFEGRKRTTTSVNDINQAGNIALYTLDKFIRSAGSGLTVNNGALFGCAVTVANSAGQVLPLSAALPSPFDTLGITNYKLIPFVIIKGGTTPAVSGKASDALVVMTGASGLGEVQTAFSAAPTATSLSLTNTTGYAAGDLILLNDLSASSIGTPCLVEQVASAFGGYNVAPTVLPLGGEYYNGTINNKSITSFNDLNNDSVINLGNAANPPIFKVFGVGANNALMSYDLINMGGVTIPLPIADGVFELHALYGIDSNGDNVVDAWVAADDSGGGGDYSATNLMSGSAAAVTLAKKIKSVRIGLILRTSLYEKGVVAPKSVSLFSDLGAGLTYSRSFSDAERHYRYRTLESSIPLRNLLLVGN